MTIRAAGEICGASCARARDLRDRAGAGIAKKDSAFELLAGAEAVANLRHLGLRKTLYLCRGNPFFGAKFGILLGQAAQECAHMLSIAVRQAQLGVVHVKLQR